MNKRIITAAIAAFFVVTALAAFIQPDTADGTDDVEYWTSEPMEKIGGYYEVSSPGHLVYIQENIGEGGIFVEDDKFKVVGDFDMSGKNFKTPIGTGTEPFVYEFDGNGKTVSGLTMDLMSNYAGLFGKVSSDADIHDLILRDVSITTTGDFVGGVAGCAEDAFVKNCVVSGTISGKGYVGGIVGNTISAELSGDRSTAAVTATDDMSGGVVGYAEGMTLITGCHNEGDITGTMSVGGVAGRAMGTSTVEKCHNTGKIKGSDYVAGVIGLAMNDSSLTDCYNTGGIEGDGYIGGVIGRNDKTSLVEDCHNTGRIAGTHHVGGIIGYNETEGSVKNCYNTGSIKGNSNVGGIIGQNFNTCSIRICYNTGSIEGTDPVGGIVGSNDKTGAVSLCYNTGTVKGDDRVGGIVGVNEMTGDIRNVYNRGSVTGTGGSVDPIVGSGNPTTHFYWLGDESSTDGARTLEQMTGTGVFEELEGFTADDWTLKGNTRSGDIETVYFPQLKALAENDDSAADSLESVKMEVSMPADKTMLYIGFGIIGIIAVLGLLYYFLILKPF